MWIFLNDSFVSIVKHRHIADCLVVRARREGDLEALLGNAIRIHETPRGDYRYRTFTTPRAVTEALSRRLYTMDYDNFKKSVKDEGRARVYLNVWMELAVWQDMLHDKGLSLADAWRRLTAWVR